MSVELTMLLYSVALLVILIVVQAGAGVLEKGIVAMAGARPLYLAASFILEEGSIVSE